MHYDRISIGAISIATLFIAWIAAPDVRAPESAAPDTLQTRPLRALMTELGQDMSRVSDGIWREDFEMIGSAALRIAHHPRVPANERTLIQDVLKDQFPQFVAFDQTVHRTALALAEAAKARELAAVLDQADRLTSACVSCHTSFREIVRRAFWQDALREPAAPGHD